MFINLLTLDFRSFTSYTIVVTLTLALGAIAMLYELHVLSLIFTVVLAIILPLLVAKRKNEDISRWQAMWEEEILRREETQRRYDSLVESLMK